MAMLGGAGTTLGALAACAVVTVGFSLTDRATIGPVGPQSGAQLPAQAEIISSGTSEGGKPVAQPPAESGNDVAGAAGPEADGTASAPMRDATSAAASEAVTEGPSAVPSFDLVRVDPGAPALVAGRAAPGAEVILRLGDTEVGRATADTSGQFVVFPLIPPLDTAKVLSLAATDATGTRHAAEDVILLPDARPGSAVPPSTAIASADPGAAIGGPDDVAGLQDAPSQTEPEDGAGLAVLLSGPDGVRALGPATRPDADVPEESDFVLIDTISYDAEGAVTLSGRADPDAREVRFYLDNDASGTASVSHEGQWQAELTDIGPGTYTLRVDSLDGDGTVIARAESPFRRESRDALAAATPETREAPVQAVTVQPGNTLWAIAREQYGSGPLYVRLVEANTDQIRNPDLIYPGQVFSIPE